MNITEGDILKIKHFLLDNVSPVLIFLFGSTVSGNFRPDSDIDVAFLTTLEFSDYECFMLAQQLADILSRDVDLINLAAASSVLQAQVVGKGEVIYAQDRQIEAEFKIRALKNYAFLNEERFEIIDRIRKEGEIYE